MYKELTTNTPPCKVSNYSRVTVPDTEYVSRAIIAQSKKREEKLGSYQVDVSISDSKVLARASDKKLHARGTKLVTLHQVT